MTDRQRLTAYTAAAICLGIAGFLTGLLLLALAVGWWGPPADWFSGRGTPREVGRRVAARVVEAVAEWRLLLAAVAGFQLMLTSAVAVAAARAARLDPGGAGLLRFSARLAIFFELLRFGPLTLLLMQVWLAIRDFFPDPGRFPQLPGLDPVPVFSEPQAAWLSRWMSALLAALLLGGMARIGFYAALVRFLNRPRTGALFGRWSGPPDGNTPRSAEWSP